MDFETAHQLRFSRNEPITEPVTKFGGRPVWLDEPTWPLSAETGTQMTFIGQVRLPGAETRVAYLFMTDDEDHVDGTWDPEGGENACLVQPGPVPSFVRTAPLAAGPTYDHDFAVTLEPVTDEVTCGDTVLGGEPGWLQAPEWPQADGTWRFVGQFAGLPFDVEPNFGDAGTAYAFVDETTWEGRFLWQCY